MKRSLKLKLKVPINRLKIIVSSRLFCKKIFNHVVPKTVVKKKKFIYTLVSLKMFILAFKLNVFQQFYTVYIFMLFFVKKKVMHESMYLTTIL